MGLGGGGGWWALDDVNSVILIVHGMLVDARQANLKLSETAGLLGIFHCITVSRVNTKWCQ